MTQKTLFITLKSGFDIAAAKTAAKRTAVIEILAELGQLAGDNGLHFGIDASETLFLTGDKAHDASVVAAVEAMPAVKSVKITPARRLS